jgi:hypothetical protein
LGFAVTLSLLLYFRDPERANIRILVILGLALFVIELIATFLDIQYNYKQKIAGFFRKNKKG